MPFSRTNKPFGVGLQGITHRRIGLSVKKPKLQARTADLSELGPPPPTNFLKRLPVRAYTSASQETRKETRQEAR
jgi:hypothetical protein